ncbi:MAG: tetratricopeptide repeat protein [Phycisphaerae bacterium]|jgi:tetratricopeptide (TPR) repeat protein|nr:tetratricopeptide repeat protein [Phycisphaerae bacterium]
MQSIRFYIIIVFLLGLNGCSLVNPDLAEGIREGQKQYARKNYLGAERLLTAAISKDPRSPAVAEAYYIRGLARLKLYRMNIAQQDFKRALALATRDDLKANVHVCLASIAFEQEDWDTAYKYYKAAEVNLPILSPSDWILFRLASSAQRSGRWEEGKKYFGRILREYPNSEVAKSAKRYMNCQYFTIQTGAFSNASGAQAQMSELRQAGLPARSEIINVNGKTLKRVSVGRYNYYSQASKGLAKVQKVVPNARIVP